MRNISNDTFTDNEKTLVVLNRNISVSHCSAHAAKTKLHFRMTTDETIFTNCPGHQVPLMMLS